MLRIRAHHLPCIPRFYRGGYDEKFAKNMKRIVQEIRKNPNVKIKLLVAGPDDICKKCPYIFNNVCIQSQKVGKWVVSQDKKIAKHLKLNKNSIHNAKDIFNLTMEKATPENIRYVCKGCIYLKNCTKVGVNDSFMKDINRVVKPKQTIKRT